MSKKQQEITGQEPGLGGSDAARPSRSRNLPGLGGNVGVMHLAEHLDDPDRRVRERALFELARLGDDRALNGLLEMMQTQQDDRSCSRAIRALGTLGDPRAVHPLMECVTRAYGIISQEAAALALRRICETHPEILDDVVSHLLSHLLPRVSLDGERAIAALMLGELGNVRAVESLITIVSNSSSHVGYYVIPALGMLGKRHADVAPYIFNELRKYGRRVGVDKRWIDAILIIGLHHEDLAEEVACELKEILLRCDPAGVHVYQEGDAARALGEIAARRPSTAASAIDALRSALKSTDRILVKYAALALAGIDDERAAEALRQAFTTCEPYMQAYLVKSLGQKGMIEPLIEMLASDSELRWRVAEGLGVSGDLRAVEPLIGLLASDEIITRREAAKALGMLRSPQAVQPLIEALSDGRKEVRRAAAEALGKIEKAHPGTAECAVPVLIALLDDETRSVQEATAKTLERIQTDEAHEAVWQWRFPDARKEA